MLRTKLVLIAVGAALGAAFASPSPSSAQTAPSAAYVPRVLRARPHIVITPRRLFYRRCVDWLELQYRPSGPVLYPQYRCWWVRR